MSMKLTAGGLPLATALLFCTSLYAQIGGGSIYGRVFDREGKPLQGAIVRVEHLATHQVDNTKTGKNGGYSMTGLFQGQYKVTLLLNGAAVMVHGESAGDAILVADGREVDVNFDLRKAPATPSPAPATAPAARDESKKGDDKAAKKADTEMRSAFNAGLAAMKEKNYEEGVKQFNAAAEKDPTQPAIFANLGVALSNLKKYDDSVAAFRKAIELKSDDPALFANLSATLADAGKIEEAAKAVEELAKLNPSFAGLGYYNLGIVLINRGKSKEAVETFSKAIEIDPKNAKSYYQLGLAYFGSTDTMPQAVSNLEKYLQLEPTGPYANAAKQLLEAAKAQTGPTKDR